MKPPPFTYHAPTSVADVVALLKSHDNARLLAGGQSLMPMMNMRYAQPDHIIDINGVAGLSYIRESGQALDIGAMTRQRDLEFSDLVAQRCPVLREAIVNVGHRQTRNRGTIGGSLCHLDPAAELPLIAALYEAQVNITSGSGTRAVAFSEFAQGFMTPGLAADEMLTAVKIPLWPASAGYGFVEFARRHGDFALAAAAVLMLVEAGRISKIAIAIGGASAIPLKMKAAEAILVGQAPTSENFVRAAATCAEIDALDDAHSPAAYRKHLAGVVMTRALREASRRTGA